VCLCACGAVALAQEIVKEETYLHTVATHTYYHATVYNICMYIYSRIPTYTHTGTGAVALAQEIVKEETYLHTVAERLSNLAAENARTALARKAMVDSALKPVLQGPVQVEANGMYAPQQQQMYAPVYGANGQRVFAPREIMYESPQQVYETEERQRAVQAEEHIVAQRLAAESALLTDEHAQLQNEAAHLAAVQNHMGGAVYAHMPPADALARAENNVNAAIGQTQGGALDASRQRAAAMAVEAQARLQQKSFDAPQMRARTVQLQAQRKHHADSVSSSQLFSEVQSVKQSLEHELGLREEASMAHRQASEAHSADIQHAVKRHDSDNLVNEIDSVKQSLDAQLGIKAAPKPVEQHASKNKAADPMEKMIQKAESRLLKDPNVGLIHNAADVDARARAIIDRDINRIGRPVAGDGHDGDAKRIRGHDDDDRLGDVASDMDTKARAIMNKLDDADVNNAQRHTAVRDSDIDRSDLTSAKHVESEAQSLGREVMGDGEAGRLSVHGLKDAKVRRNACMYVCMSAYSCLFVMGYGEAGQLSVHGLKKNRQGEREESFVLIECVRKGMYVSMHVCVYACMRLCMCAFVQLCSLWGMGKRDD
jgi:hypothetical protein